MDGYVTIGTKLDTEELKQEIKNAEKELKKFEREGQQLAKQRLKIQIEFDKYGEIIDKYEHIQKLYDELKRDVATGDIDPFSQQYMDNLREIGDLKRTSFGNLSEPEMLAYVDEAYQKYGQLNEQLDQIDEKIDKNAESQKRFNSSIGAMNNELANIKNHNENVENMGKSFNKIGNFIGTTVKKVIKWGLALLGVRTILSVLTRSFSTLSQYNEGLASKMEGIKLLLAVSFEPVINWLISALQVVMQIIGTIYKTLFGIDIYARANELSAKKMAKSFGSASKSAKDMRKQLAGFDEMNVLADNVKASGGAGGGADSLLPDIGNLEEIQKVKDVFEWIKKNKEPIKGALGGVFAYIYEKLGPKGLLATIGGLPTAIGLYWKDIVKITKYEWQVVSQVVGNVFDWIKEKATKVGENMVLHYIKVWNNIKTGANNLWTGIKNVFGTIQNFMLNVATIIASHFQSIWNSIKTGASNTWEGVKSVFSGVTNFFGNIINHIIGFFRDVGTRVGDAIGGAFKSAINGVLRAVETILNSPIRAINGLIGAINKLPGVNFSKLSTFSLPRLAKGGIINQPGKGVMIGSAIAGERGAEGVIPLTDSQQMALLGEAIGRYITINATITNTMNGKVISRELQKIQNDRDFAYNR